MKTLLCILLLTGLAIVSAKPNPKPEPKPIINWLVDVVCGFDSIECDDIYEDVHIQYRRIKNGTTVDNSIKTFNINELRDDIGKLKDTIVGKGFDKTKQTKIFAHGHKQVGIGDWCDYYIEAYENAGFDINFFCIDWYKKDKLADRPYKQAAKIAVKIGQEFGWQVIKRLINNNLKQDRSLIHAVGNSYGAHLVGNAGRNADGIIGRITGLDPGRPWFHNKANQQYILKKTDADLVDVIHTNGGEAGSAITGKYGIKESLGHFDFFPAGGQSQPECKGKDGSGWLNNLLSMCSHNRAAYYYTESIENYAEESKVFEARACADWDTYKAGKCDKNCALRMGEGLVNENFNNVKDNEGRTCNNWGGDYYLDVNDDSPYSKNGE